MQDPMRNLTAEEIDLISGGNGLIDTFRDWVIGKLFDLYTSPEFHADWWDVAGDAVKRGELMPM
jgi:hypothetical protein